MKAEHEVFLARIPDSVTDRHALAKWCAKEWVKITEALSTTSTWTYGLAIRLGFKGHMREWSEFIENADGVPSKVSAKTKVPKRRPKLQIHR
jgi:hypothetical protein